MKVYIANCTDQVHDFAYRLPEMPIGRPAIRQQIHPRSQVKLSGDLNTPDIEAVVRQHARYGLAAVDEVATTDHLINLVYSIDRPISEETIRYVIGRNEVVLRSLGHRLRQEAAIAVNNQLDEAAPAAKLKAVELTVQEEETRSNPEPSFAETIKVDRTAPVGAPPRVAPEMAHRGRRRGRKVA